MTVVNRTTSHDNVEILCCSYAMISKLTWRIALGHEASSLQRFFRNFLSYICTDNELYDPVTSSFFQNMDTLILKGRRTPNYLKMWSVHMTAKTSLSDLQSRLWWHEYWVCSLQSRDYSHLTVSPCRIVQSFALSWSHHYIGSSNNRGFIILHDQWNI